MIIEEEEYLAHYGTPRHSGRYPWGSGNNELPQDNASLLDYVADMKRKGLTEGQIAEGLGISTTDLRAHKSIARHEIKQAQILQARSLQEKGFSNGAIAKRMGLAGESSVRALTASGVKERNDILTSTADMLKRQVAEKGMVDVGAGNEHYIGETGISQTRFNTALAILKAEGYAVETINVTQLGTGKETRQKVLAPPGTTWGDIKRNQSNIRTIQEFSNDGGRSFNKIQPPLAIHPNRVDVNYKEDGGDKADGVIYVRPGVEDISIGENRYAQVRIQVGKDRYLKGMAIYKDDLPEGVDLVFNTNKSKAEYPNKLHTMKKLENDPELPFGSVVRQITKDGKVTSAMNIVGHKETSGIEGGWDEWASTLSSQMLSKQSPTLVKEQLNLTYDRRRKEFDEIMSLTNPTVKKKLLEEFADSADSAAVHLKAAAMPRQATRVILPVNSLKETEVYAPGFRDGELVALVRYPHGGTFEIPELTVNNRHPKAKKLLGEARDAVAINADVAKRLSGADFDGDTVIVIPNNARKVKNSRALEGLKDFDPSIYKFPEDSPAKRMDAHTKGVEMGKISNLITDMTIRGAPHSDIVRAIRHSMVVIDAEKHELNWKLSAQKENIRELTRQYQTPYRETGVPGASTLISRAGSKKKIPELIPRRAKEGGPIDRTTGRKVMVPSGVTTINRKGERVLKTREYKLLELTDDAHTLSSGVGVEKLYADHSNRLKSLANEARLSSTKTPRLNYSRSAKQTYSEEAKSLRSKLTLAQMNAPKERQAQIVANAQVRARLQANPNLEPSTIKKLKNQALDEARIRTGARKQKVVITDKEWDAIQAGAISDYQLSEILKHSDMEVVKKYATPRTQKLMTSAKTSKARRLLDSGATRAEVADALGVSLTTLDTAING